MINNYFYIHLIYKSIHFYNYTDKNQINLNLYYIYLINNNINYHVDYYHFQLKILNLKKNDYKNNLNSFLLK